MDTNSNTKAGQAQKVIAAVIDSGAWKGTLYVDGKTVVRATRKWIKRQRKQDSDRFDMVVSFGKPNYREREFLAKCKKAGEPLPVKKVQLQFKTRKGE